MASHPYGQHAAHAGNADPGLLLELSGRGKTNEFGNLQNYRCYIMVEATMSSLYSTKLIKTKVRRGVKYVQYFC